MQCPQCGSRRFEVELNLNGFVRCAAQRDGTLEILDDVQLNSEWRDDAECRCLRCIWEGTLDDVRERRRQPAAQRTRNGNAGTPPATLNRIRSAADVRQRLAADRCPEPWRECLEFLLQKNARDVRMIELLKLANEREHTGNPGDTSLM